LTLDETRRRLRSDFPFYAQACLKVLDRGRLTSFTLRPAQRRLCALLSEQRARGAAQGAVILKARKIGFSTLAQGLIVQRTTLTPYHAAATIAHDMPTAGKLMEIAGGSRSSGAEPLNSPVGRTEHRNPPNCLSFTNRS